MAKSKIIKDFTEYTNNLSVILKKLIVLFHDLKNDDLIEWARNELNGYSEASKVPSYRRIRSVVRGTYVVGNMKYKNASTPIAGLPDIACDDLTHELMTQSIQSLENMLKNYKDSGSMMRPLAPELFPLLESASNIHILEAHKQFDLGKIQDIISKLDDKILEILLLLEKEFGNLDNLDIDISSKTSDGYNVIIQNLNVLIYDDKSITLGNNNTIKNSNINS